MLHFVIALFLNLSPSTQSANACETYAARLDGVRVTVCAGSVVRACDAANVCTDSK